jgi:histidyl-tRNA synthetase
VPEDQPIIATLPKIADYLDEPCREHFASLRRILDALGVRYAVNPRLVRGLDYYQRTTFEFTHGALGAQNAILGGGRYDGLSEAIGGPRAPGIGFAIGEDRLVLTLMESAQLEPPQPDAYIAPLGAGMDAPAAVLARELREAGLIIALGDETFRLKKSFETAEKLGARAIVIVGENEVAAGRFTVKDLIRKEQQTVERAALAIYLRAAAEPVGAPDAAKI